MAMKILNWMQWKMKPNTVYSRVSHKHPPDVFADGKEMETNDQEALLLHNVLLDGILTIGTLGLQDIHHHHSPLIKHQQDYDNDKLEDEKNVSQEAVEQVEIKVAMVPLSVSKSLRSSFREKENEKVVVKVMKEQDQHCDHKELMDEPLLKEDKERSEKGRTTLADLFAASDASPKKAKSSTSPLKEKINKEPTKEDEKKKKLMTMNKNKENSLVEGKTKPTIKATKKMQRLITRMMKKKKVHPEMVVNGMTETVSLMSKEMEKISLINQDIEEHPWRDQAVHQIG
ncbi:NAD(P)-binding domain-containing protein [Dioscorea alata]|uniref:NAD(P)-binding domain-containing protein n=1 Tax=Dioscorea alata TaxID=55571 RepID=A0ACB7WVW1_DIOAL|nr:NAD(P)-binding domain-containing protein [Dioscorea alata]